MKYGKAFDVTSIPEGLRQYIQPGQWVYAHGNAKGQYMGRTRAGVDVIAWDTSKRTTLRAYAKRAK